MTRKNLPTDADIFITASKKQTHWLKTTGIVSAMLLIVVGVNTVVALSKQPVEEHRQASTKSTANAQHTPEFYAVLPRDVIPRTTMPNTNLLAQSNQPITIAHPTTVPVNPNGNVDFGGYSNQINQLQAQIVQQMQTCVGLSRQAQSRVAQLRAQEQQLQDAIREINRAISSVRWDDPNGQATREGLRRQRDAANFERNQILREISATKSQYSSDKSNCFNTVNRMNTAKRNLENQLRNAFNSSLNVRFP